MIMFCSMDPRIRHLCQPKVSRLLSCLHLSSLTPGFVLMSWYASPEPFQIRQGVKLNLHLQATT